MSTFRAMLTDLLVELDQSHFPNPPASERQIRQFEERMGWPLDEELRAFYLHCNGARLFRKKDPNYRILELEEVVRTRIAIYGRDEAEWGPDSFYIFCDMQDTNYVSLDVARRIDNKYPLFDCFHENFYESDSREMIARCLSDFLKRAFLRPEGSYWLDDNWTGV